MCPPPRLPPRSRRVLAHRNRATTASGASDSAPSDERGFQVGLVRRHEHGLRLRLALCRILWHRPVAQLSGAPLHPCSSLELRAMISHSIRFSSCSSTFSSRPTSAAWRSGARRDSTAGARKPSDVRESRLRRWTGDVKRGGMSRGIWMRVSNALPCSDCPPPPTQAQSSGWVPPAARHNVALP